jgi:hypothetical protein
MATAEELAALAERVAAYQAAELAVLRNQSYEMPDGRKLTRANLRDIQKGLAEAKADYAAATGVSIVRGRARRGWNMST